MPASILCGYLDLRTRSCVATGVEAGDGVWRCIVRFVACTMPDDVSRGDNGMHMWTEHKPNAGPRCPWLGAGLTAGCAACACTLTALWPVLEWPEHAAWESGLSLVSLSALAWSLWSGSTSRARGRGTIGHHDRDCGVQYVKPNGRTERAASGAGDEYSIQG
eukprot:914774-Prymnesium_polylepis.4